MRQAGSRSLGRVLSVGLLFVLLGAVSTALVQCTMTGDRVAGVNLSRLTATGCIQQCNDLYATLYKQEQQRHQVAVAECLKIQDNALRNACQQTEAGVHAARMDELSSGKLACQDGCHVQGAGSSG